MASESAHKSSDCWLMAAGINGLLAVAAGAFAAHGLKQHLTTDMLAVFETGARYHMYHALALAITAMFLRLAVASQSRARRLNIAAWAFQIGIVLFSGSLYLLAVTSTKWLGAITPFGGLGFLVGWLFLVIASRGRESEVAG